MRPTRGEMMEGLMSCSNDSESVTYFETILDRMEAGGAVIADRRPADDGPSEVATMPATGTRGEIDWLQANVVAIGETCADNASRLTDVEGSTTRRITEQLQRLTTLTGRVEVLEAARNRRRGDRLWRGLRWMVWR